ncbi:MAG: hypothetical protein ACP5N7_01950 [Candidatus Pacearchaeota archaeon]
MAKKEQTGEEIKAASVSFTPEQLDLVQKMIEASKTNGTSTRGAISRYTDVRDPKSIEQVNVSRFDGKFVIGFKDLNKDPYRKAPKYSENKLDISRKLADQPFVTLLLSNNGKDIEEKEVSLVDYMNNREKMPCKAVKVHKKEIIDDKGLLGRQGASGMASAIDENNKLLEPLTVRAEVKRVELFIDVEIPGFSEPVSFIEAFLA